MSKQPIWKLVGNLGDANPIEHGGYFVFQDTTGVYSPEAEYWNPDSGLAYRVVLDRCHLLDGHLILESIYQKSITGTLHYPIATYTEWFDEELESVASCVGTDVTELKRLFCSADPLELAVAYQATYEYHGWENGDSDPLRLSEAEAEERYSKYVR